MKERPLVKSLAAEQSTDAALGVLSHFRVEFYDCLYSRADALFELTDAVLCADGPVTSLVELTLTAEHRRGHGAMYDAVNHGWLEPRRLRRLLASTPLPRAADGRIVLAVDVSNWLRPDAPTTRPSETAARLMIKLTPAAAAASPARPACLLGPLRVRRPTVLLVVGAPRHAGG
ncbi:hypothetical protein SHKM778_83240 [Streptomyces sp. KM77-8]|uniref:Transposase IS701-like DDE domain-containing protein n=1 Tax=Streptomyces haneummycinicus TaxID=3074435 RepID=A0AAT9HWH8_9ACTN